MADDGNQRCKYVGQCTLYKSHGKSGCGEYSALSEEVRRQMCESISSDNDGVPCVPDTGRIGGGGVICEAYFARKTIEDLLKTAQAGLSDEKKKIIPGKGG